MLTPVSMLMLMVTDPSQRIGVNSTTWTDIFRLLKQRRIIRNQSYLKKWMIPLVTALVRVSFFHISLRFVVFWKFSYSVYVFWSTTWFCRMKNSTTRIQFVIAAKSKRCYWWWHTIDQIDHYNVQPLRQIRTAPSTSIAIFFSNFQSFQKKSQPLDVSIDKKIHRRSSILQFSPIKFNQIVH